MSAEEKIGIEIKSNLKETKDQLKQVDAQLAKLNKQKPSLQIRAEKLQNAKTEISKINVQLKELAAKKATIKADASNITDAKKKMTEITTQMDKLRARKAVLQVTTEKLKGADKDIKNLDKNMRSLSKQQAVLNIRAEGLEQAQSNLSQFENAVKNMPSVANEGLNFSSALNSLGSGFDKVGSKMLGFLNPFASKLNQMIGLGAVFKVIDSGVNMVKNSVDGAIDRFDQLNNFPKVMSNLKIGPEESKKALDELSNGLNGLPTTLNDASVSVQQFTSKNKDVGKSTKMFLALNNTILAGGASTEIQSSALEQLSQGYSKGKIDMMEWRSALTAMPAQIDQVAQAFGMSSDSLGEALRNGDISMDQFMDKIVELNEKGANGFKTFEEQARNSTGGIKTSIKTMMSAVTRGVTKIMGATDEALKKSGVGGFTGLFSGIGKMFENGLGQVGVYIEKNQEKINAFVAKLKELADAAGKYLKNFKWNEFAEGLKETISGGKEFISGFKPVLGFLQKMITNLGDGSFEKGLGKIPKTLIQWGIGFKIAGKALQLFSGPLGKFLNLKLFGEGKITTFDAFKGNMFDGITSFAKNAGNLALVFGAIKLVGQAAEALRQLDEKVPNDFGAMASKIGSMTLAIGAMGLLAFAASKVPTKEMFAGLAAIAFISVDLMIAAEALRQIDEKVPGDFSNIVPKLGSMALAIIGMGALVAAAGALAMLNPIGAVAGLAAVATLSVELMLAAEALQQINQKVPDDLGSIVAKIGSIAIAILGMGAIATAVGAFVSTGIGAVAIGAGLVTIAAIAFDLIKVADAIKQVNDNVPDDMGSVKKKVSSIIDVIQYMTNADLGGLVETFKNIFKGFNVSAVSGVVSKMASLGEDLSTFPEIDPQKALDSIDGVKKVINKLSDGEGFIDKIKKLAGSFVDTKQIDQIKTYVSSLKSIVTSLKSIDGDKVDYKAVQKRLKEIIGAIGVLGDDDFTEKLNKIGKSDKFNNVKEIISSLKDIMTNINSLSANIDIAPIRINIGILKEVIGMLGNKELFKDYGMGKNEGSKPFASMVKTIGHLVTIGQKLNELSANINIEAAKINIGLIKEVIGMLNMNEIFANYGMGKGEGSGPFRSMTKTMGHLVTIANKLNELGININYAAAETNIDLIKKAIGLVSDPSIKENYGNMLKDDQFKAIHARLSRFVDIANKLNELAINIAYDAAATNIDLIKDTITRISDPAIKESYSAMLKMDQWKAIVDRLTQVVAIGHKINEFSFDVNTDGVTKVIGEIKKVVMLLADPELKEAYEQMMKPEDWERIIISANALIQLKNKFSEIANNPISSDAVSGEIQKVKGLIQEIAEFPSYQGIESLYELVLAFTKLIDTLNGLTGKFKPIGKGYGQQIVNGFNSVNIPKKFVAVIDSAISKLKSKTSSFLAIGKSYGDALNNGFGQGLSNMAGKIDAQITNLNAKARQFSGLGNSFGQLLADSFDAQIQNLSTNTTKQIEIIQASLNNLKLPGVTNRRSSNAFDNAMTLSTGGSVEPQYRATGGVMFQPKGTDTVPAMLTPGEYVQNADAVKTFGLDFMNRVNSLDLKGAYQAFTNRFANKLATQPIMNTVNNNVVNNNTSNNNARVNQYMSGSDSGHSLRRAKRIMNRL